MYESILEPSDAGALGRCGIAIHDAGSSLHVAEWIPDLPHVSAILADGPAGSLGAVKTGPRVRDTGALVEASDWLLVGTGWQSDLERDALRAGRVA